jgi:glycosyltransferase involved in cell wall biosynthesis
MSNLNLPKVSCICPTFCRAYLLEEAVESFLRQDYEGEKELIICNDFIDQEIIFDHPLVKVINLPERTKTLGEKRNITYSYATGEYMITWGDDDIHLPRRISRMVNAALKLNTEFLFEGPYIILYDHKLYKEPGSTCGANIISKKLFKEVGGIPEENIGEDIAFNNKVKAYLKTTLNICLDEPQFLYRWSSNRVHISQFIEDKENQENSYEKVFRYAKEYIEKGLEPKGRYELQPHWKKDWVEEIKSAIIK